MVQLVERLPSRNEAPGSIPSTIETRHGDTPMSSQHLGGRGKRIRNTRSSLAIIMSEASLNYSKVCLKSGTKLQLFKLHFTEFPPICLVVSLGPNGNMAYQVGKFPMGPSLIATLVKCLEFPSLPSAGKYPYF